jgi:hypothetical protein
MYILLTRLPYCTIVDLGVQLTNCAFEKTIVLENKGRRHQQLRWINRTNIEENQAKVSKKGEDFRTMILSYS